MVLPGTLRMMMVASGLRPGGSLVVPPRGAAGGRLPPDLVLSLLPLPRSSEVDEAGAPPSPPLPPAPPFFLASSSLPPPCFLPFLAAAVSLAGEGGTEGGPPVLTRLAQDSGTLGAETAAAAASAAALRSSSTFLEAPLVGEEEREAPRELRPVRFLDFFLSADLGVDSAEAAAELVEGS